uniref:Uncharacterized protein n=2 Tax=Aegilops tauschii subsp. strangulata TaxID=200361 RepID=A0A453EUG5_AEGTS
MQKPPVVLCTVYSCLSQDILPQGYASTHSHFLDYTVLYISPAICLVHLFDILPHLSLSV